MSRIRESLVVLVDISPAMHNDLQVVKNAVSRVIQRKIFYTKNDEVGFVVFGAEEPNNELHNDLGGYESVAVLHPIKVVEEELLEALNKLPKGTSHGDYLDAIVVGIDLLIKKLGPGSKGNKRLLLITGAQSRIKEPYEGTKEEQADIIAVQMSEHGIKLEIVVYCPRMVQPKRSEIFKENVSLLERFPKKAQAQMQLVEDSTSLLGAVRARNITPVTIFRGDLEMTPNMKIKVWVYKKTCQERLPTLKKYSDKAPPNDQHATREVKFDVEYKSKEDPDKTIPPEQRIKGYYYGPQVVPISSLQEEALKFKAEKGLKLLGFTDAASIPRHYYMKDVNIFIPEPGNEKAVLALSAIARAMKEAGKVAIVRCVWRQGQTSVVLGVLTPNLSDSLDTFDSFYFNVIPFAEDVREFPFPSFDTYPATQQPNSRQQEAADNLVQMLDLVAPGRQEILQPDLTPNPVLERFFRFTDAKSRNPICEVPSLDNELKRITEPDPEILTETELVINRFCSEFQLKINRKKEKGGKRFWRDKPSLSDEAKKDEENDASAAQSEITFESLTAKKVDKVGSLTPVQDFESMLSRRDSDEWVPKAIKEIKKVIVDLLEYAYNGNTYDKALDCLVSLRKGCVEQEEPAEFNNFMQEIAVKCQVKRLADFWNLIVSRNITLINRSEAADSDVTEEKARAFLEKASRPPEQEQEVDEMEELLGEIV